MNLDPSIVKSLNHFGEHNLTLVKICSNDFVYAVILIAAAWLVARTVKFYTPIQNYQRFVVDLIIKGIMIFAIPVGVATVISELISKIYVRQRPFISEQGVKLLVPHSADGGMPSHHLVFMTSLITMIYFYNKRLSWALGALALFSGIARVAAGIHYPSDIIVGFVLGWAVSYVYVLVSRKFLSGLPKI